jgi:hypothetical protein
VLGLRSERGMARRLALVLLTGACLTALTGCGSGSGSERGAAGAAKSSRLTDIGSVLQLRAMFNEDRGAPRLLLLLSPT